MAEAREPNCPPSSEAVLDALESSDGPLDPAEIQAKTGLARRTVYLALHCLLAMKAIVKGMTLRDARRRRYKIVDDE